MLLQRNIVKKYLTLLGENQTIKPWEQYQSYFLNEDIQANIQKIKEEQFQEGFLRELFVKVLGYTINPSPNYNLTTELKNEVGSKKADGAILVNGKVAHTQRGYILEEVGTLAGLNPESVYPVVDYQPGGRNVRPIYGNSECGNGRSPSTRTCQEITIPFGSHPRVDL